MKLDLIAVKNGVGTAMDVSIICDNRSATALLDKKEKYEIKRQLAAIRLALSHVGSPVDRIFDQPIILLYRGFCDTKSAKALILKGLHRYGISDLCLLTIKGPLNTHDVFMRGTWEGLSHKNRG